MFQFGAFLLGLIWLGLAACPFARATEHVILKNGFELDCVPETIGAMLRDSPMGAASGKPAARLDIECEAGFTLSGRAAELSVRLHRHARRRL